MAGLPGCGRFIDHLGKDHMTVAQIGKMPQGCTGDATAGGAAHAIRRDLPEPGNHT